MTRYVDYVSCFKSVSGFVKWTLLNLRFTRNFDNKTFVKWIQRTKPNADPETIRRAKQLLVAENHLLYGPLAITVQREKETKQLAMMEFVTTC